MVMDLKEDVFLPVVERVKERKESLRNMKRFSRSGIEGWFKVEIVAALGNKIKSIKNEGPDFTLEDGTDIKIKAATNFVRNYYVAAVKEYGCPCLFLLDGTNLPKLPFDPKTGVELIGSEIVRDGDDNWIVGMVKPMT